ncbi:MULTISPECIES: daunorubicin resistance protein DrrA family ABC transporter ATP-binding protein [Streptomyces]|uniref:daunorubicin resistance protein DrrA family ABC transporter ATP-binding protein n=1 Tax=Streptomyces TaxID=1883 RepID=UPI0004AA479B|nr:MULTISPECIES: daunorubicin resistance protein DrrA family ABC transporter ATP-binding protein [Streptomyces]
MTAPAILVEHVRKSFGEVTALDDVSFKVERGEVFALLGRNGAGKTSTVRILTTNSTPDAGRAEVLGLDTVRQAAQVRNRIGLTGQYAAVDDNLTGRENLRLIGRLTHVPRRELADRVDGLLDRFGLTEVADRPVKGYSGGTRRRLDVASALVHKPPVLFLDEPTTGLDLESRLALWDMVKELVAEGTAVLLTTQYLEEADRLAQQIAVIDGGRVVAEGSPAELKAKVGASVVEIGFAQEELVRQAADLLTRLEGSAPQREGTVLRLNADDGAAATMRAMTILDAHSLMPTTLALREPSLDDAFLALTAHTGESA